MGCCHLQTSGTRHRARSRTRSYRNVGIRTSGRAGSCARSRLPVLRTLQALPAAVPLCTWRPRPPLFPPSKCEGASAWASFRADVAELRLTCPLRSCLLFGGSESFEFLSSSDPFVVLQDGSPIGFAKPKGTQTNAKPAADTRLPTASWSEPQDARQRRFLSERAPRQRNTPRGGRGGMK